jgi:membrane associated rhomboid family serine protease
MKLPKDNIPKSRSAYVTQCLIGLIIVFYAWELSLGSNLPKATTLLGFVPARFIAQFSDGQEVFSQAILPLASSLFLHGNWMHLATNVLFLFIFGGKVEDLMGHGRFLLLYLLSGLGSNFIYLVFAPASTVALIGASGAIAGVMAAFFSLFPEVKFATLFILIWALLQLIYGIYAFFSKVAGQAGLAWWAHVGGFLLGLALIRFLAPRGVPLIPLRRERKKPPPA